MLKQTEIKKEACDSDAAVGCINTCPHLHVFLVAPRWVEYGFVKVYPKEGDDYRWCSGTNNGSRGVNETQDLNLMF